ncbi:hypothetical protein L596_026615 [Steinernema carpocapsae]|uniref:Uncharacterized protein n=1 Tax=Steinernema carpocapsae TaxID=34508 RepID=A0A4U5M1W4_STECR|nr:hypothetical protein L596_026615 [Steinernema carpocapsae]
MRASYDAKCVRRLVLDRANTSIFPKWKMAFHLDDDRVFLFLVVIAFCNLIPLLGFVAYLITLSFAIVSSAILAEGGLVSHEINP